MADFKQEQYRVLPKKALIEIWTVLEHQEELDAVLWRGFRARMPESEIVRKPSENIFSSRTSRLSKNNGVSNLGLPRFLQRRGVGDLWIQRNYSNVTVLVIF